MVQASRITQAATLGLLLGLLHAPARAEESSSTVARIDELLDQHWHTLGIQPADKADDATFLRRVSLDLIGRIPTPRELDQFLADKTGDKRRKLVERLIEGPEFPLHFGAVLDQMLQGEQAGNEAFVDYLRRSVRDGKGWDAVFREIMLGPWDAEPLKPASRFLDRRAKELDALTADATRVFFGVDISCAKCHDHPLVSQWTQDHFYGMASFFNRTSGGKGTISEKTEGDVKFVNSAGQEKTAQMMFLSGRVIDEPDKEERKKTSFSRREQLVRAALEERAFFSRSLVNRMWEQFFGRGLVHPVDQMHAQNQPAVPEVLDLLADDFSQHGYDLKRLIAAIVSTRAYALGSQWQREASVPDATAFAVFRLRPLSPQQLATSLLVAAGDGSLDAQAPTASRLERYVGVNGLNRIEQRLALEEAAKGLTASLDRRTADFQSSAAEALFLSNGKSVQSLFQPAGENLAARLQRLSDPRQTVQAAVKTILGRQATEDELKQLSQTAACTELIWALATSAEFRFNH